MTVMMQKDVKGSRVEVFDLCFDRVRSNKRILFHPKPKVENSLLGRTQFLKITKFDESVETNIFFFGRDDQKTSVWVESVKL